MVTLSDKLKALGVKTGTAGLREAKSPVQEDTSPHGIASVLQGAVVPTDFGDAFIYEEHYPAEHKHGATGIRPAVPLRMLSAWAGDARLRDLPLESFVFLDTETSGLSGGTGTYAFLIGAARFMDDGQLVLRQFFMRDPAEEPATLDALARFIAPSQVMVTYNGKSFDAPLLQTRYRLHQQPVPFAKYAHLDLLPLARRLWRERLESRSLKYIEEHVLGLTRATEEVQGFEIPWLYFDYLRTGDARPLKGVFYHNAMDVVAMAALLGHTAHMLEDPFHEDVDHGLDVLALARMYEESGEWETAARLFEHCLQMDLEEAHFWQALGRLAILQKRRGDFAQAVPLWEQAAAQGHVYAFIELAKYHEHRQRDASSALQWTQDAAEALQASELPKYMRKHYEEDLRKRKQRLQQKMKQPVSNKLKIKKRVTRK